MTMAEHRTLAPDLVLTGGRVLTMDARNSEAQALAIRDGRIVAVGANDDVLRLAGDGTEVVDLDGRTALPGLTDCHVHLASDAGRSVNSAECRDFYDTSIASVADLVDRLREQAQQVPPGAWVVGRGSPLQD